MCGIAGILSTPASAPPTPTELAAMIGQLHHGGSDGPASYCAAEVGLAHARLSIIDLSSGDQPIHNEDKSVWVVFNGEIFNYIELCAELERARVEFYAGDLLEPFNQSGFHGQFDLLVCNLPYISSQKVDAMAGEISGFEPRLAFDGGPLGVRILRRLIREAPAYLRKGGWLAFEVGLGHGPAVLKHLQADGAFSEHRSVRDAQGEIRLLAAR